MKWQVPVGSFLFVLLAAPVMSATIDVPGDYPTIQQAVAAASDGDTIEVQPEYYPEDVIIQSRLLHIIGVEGSNSTSANSFTWTSSSRGDAPDGSLVGFEVLGPVVADLMEGDFYIRQCVVWGEVYCQILLDNFDKIQLEASEFYAPVQLLAFNELALIYVTDCTFYNAFLDAYSNDDAVVIDCSLLGQGMRVNGETFLFITNNFLQNSGIQAITGDLAGGSVSNNVVTGAEIGIEATGDFQNGGEVNVVGNTVRKCNTGILAASYTFVDDNEISLCSTGISLGEDCTATSNLIYKCGNGIGIEGGIPNLVPHPQAQNNTIHGCSQFGIFYLPLPPENLGDLANNIIAENGAGVSVPAVIDSDLIHCNDVWSNPGGNWFGITDPTGSNGNISLDPRFCDSSLPDFRLRPSSPCVPFSQPNPECDLIGARPVGCDPSSVDDDSASPGASLLAPACPNPVAHSARITYSIPEGGRATIRIFDVSGRLVRTLTDGYQPPGVHTVSWDGRSTAGDPVGNGLYFYQMTWKGRTEAGRLVLIR